MHSRNFSYKMYGRKICKVVGYFLRMESRANLLMLKACNACADTAHCTDSADFLKMEIRATVGYFH